MIYRYQQKYGFCLLQNDYEKIVYNLHGLVPYLPSLIFKVKRPGQEPGRKVSQSFRQLLTLGHMKVVIYGTLYFAKKIGNYPRD